MKILHVIGDLAPRHGGPTKLVPEICRALARQGHQVSLFTTNRDGPTTLNVPTDRPVETGGVTMCYFRAGHPRRWVSSWPLAQALRREIPRCDIVHIHCLYLFHTCFSTHYCRKYRVPYLVSPHGTLDPFLRRKSRVKKAIYTFLIEQRNLDRAAAIHYTTQAELELAHAAMGIRAPGVVVPLGLDLEDYANLPTIGGLRQKFPEIGDRHIILYLSRINFKKGLDILARSFGEVARQRDDVHLVIAGPDNEGYGARVRQWLAEENVSDRVTFTGMLLGAEKMAALRDAYLFILPSYTENFGIAVVEAMACGLPVIISDQVNIYREVEEWGAGKVTPCDSGRVAAAILELVENPELAHTMGQKGMALVKERYQWQEVAKAMAEVYHNIVIRSSGRDFCLARKA